MFCCNLRGEPFGKMVEMGVKAAAARLYHVAFINLHSSLHGDILNCKIIDIKKSKNDK